MNHDYIDENLVVDRYIVGSLPPEEESRFEAHYLSCQRCLDALSVAQHFADGLHAETAERMVKTVAASRGLAGWIRSTRHLRALAAVLLIGLTAALFTLVQRTQQLAQPQQPVADAEIVRLEYTRSNDSDSGQVLAFEPGQAWIVIRQRQQTNAFTRFQVRITDASGNVRHRLLAPRTQDHIQFRLHRDSLPEGTYELTIAGEDGAAWVPVNAYAFSVRKH